MLRFLHPRWLALHVLVLGACVGMVYAAVWQWGVGEDRGNDWQNYSYTVQWSLFAVFALWFWVKVMRDTARRAADPKWTPKRSLFSSPPPPSIQLTSAPKYLGYSMPQAAAIRVDDPELADYNAYLNALADTDRPRPVDQSASAVEGNSR